MPPRMMTRRYPASMAFAVTPVKLAVLPDCTYPTTRPRDPYASVRVGSERRSTTAWLASSRLDTAASDQPLPRSVCS